MAGAENMPVAGVICNCSPSAPMAQILGCELRRVLVSSAMSRLGCLLDVLQLEQALFVPRPHQLVDQRNDVFPVQDIFRTHQLLKPHFWCRAAVGPDELAASLGIARLDCD